MTYQTAMRFLSVASFLHLVSQISNSDATGQCKSQVSTFRKALKSHTFDKFYVNRPDICIKTCMNEPRCQSINYVMEENMCELNNRSKEARPENYVTDPGKIYMTVSFNKGMCIRSSAAVAAETVAVNELVFIKESRGTKTFNFP